jgi:hypothetical protein
MECEKCLTSNKIVLWGSCEFICELCDEKSVCLHIPPTKICSNCSNEHDVCEECGEKLDNEEAL